MTSVADRRTEPAAVRWALTAAALGLAMLVMSFIMLFAINLVQAWGRRRHVAAGR
jgi:hypothetical protein